MRYHLAAPALLLCATLNAHAQCSVDLPDSTVNLYLGYEPLSCTQLEPVVTGTQPYTFVWSNGLTATSIEVCANASQWIFVTLEDATPCFATDSVYVNVVDVRCGNGLDKVLVCHVPPGDPQNAHTICVSASAVPAHFAHGCSLGDCSIVPVVPPPSEEATGYTLAVSLAPNPLNNTGTLRVISLRDQHVQVRALDPMGRVVTHLLDTDMHANEDRRIALDERDFPPGLNAVWIESVGDLERRMLPLVLAR